ncbi:hypothetical protein [Streptomyces sp. AcH 505]|uniref:hypothetical protein n=1 Tax=Streptomyces sp. AcH 505 TaxID=352211 RepID=UPI0012FEFB24
MISNLFIAAIFLFFLLRIYPYSNPYPFADDWTYAGVLGTGWANTLKWVLALHNDHRIPLMKLLQYTTLRATYFDFRSLVLINFAIGVIGSISLSEIARNYRGKSHIGDIIIPMVLLNFGTGFMGWGFSAQFLLSVSSSLVAILFFQRSENSNRARVAATLAMLVCALSGMNGIVLAVSLAACFLLFYLFVQKQNAACIGPGLVLALCALLLVTWTPSAASVSPTQTPSGQLLDWIYQFSKSSFIVSASHGGWWRAALCVGLISTAVSFAAQRTLRSLQREKQSPSEFAVYAALAAYITLFFSVVIGRSAHGAWEPGLEMHYGYLAAPIPILSWIVISRFLRGPAALIVAGSLIVVYAQSFVENTAWRMAHLRSQYAHLEQIGADLRSDAPPAIVTEKDIKFLYHVDTPDVRQQVIGGIEKLRQFGGPIYGRP